MKMKDRDFRDLSLGLPSPLQQIPTTRADLNEYLEGEEDGSDILHRRDGSRYFPKDDQVRSRGKRKSNERGNSSPMHRDITLDE